MPFKPLRKPSRLDPFRRAVLRGLGVLLPPLLTIVILLWVAGTIRQYVFEPVTNGARSAIAWYWSEQDKRLLSGEGVPELIARQERGEIKLPGDKIYVSLPANQNVFVPQQVADAVRENDPVGFRAMTTRKAVYERFVDITYMQPQRVIPLFVSVFLLVLYLLGKFLAAGVGGVFWNLFERGVHRLPLVRNVYDSVKQVTDFMFNARELEYTRVVAVEYPRKGIWSLGFVTGESLSEIRSAAGEPVLSLMIPSSPMSLTGYTISVPKSDTVDLNLTIDQALQFVISCGVVIPADQVPRSFEPAKTPAD